jgi:hypothetical protein
MSNRELVIDLVNHLPADTPLEDIADRLRFIAGVKEGIAESEQSDGYTADEVRAMLKTWTSKSPS